MLVYNAQRELFNILPPRYNAVVFIGNSVLAGCPWNELFDSEKIVNRAIGGDGTNGVLARLDDILKTNPSMLIISLGRSDIVFGLSQDSIMHNIDAIVAQARTHRPDTKIVLLSEIPWRPDIVASRPYNNKNVHALNTLVKQYADARQLPFVDFADMVSDSAGDLDSAYSVDGVHPNASAYAKLKTALDPYVGPILGKRY
jgi:lysophospholipase L1-like esterase